MPRGVMSPEKRAKATSAGGKARAATMTATDRAKGAAAVNSAEALARRIVKQWPNLSDGERGMVRAILAQLD